MDGESKGSKMKSLYRRSPTPRYITFAEVKELCKDCPNLVSMDEEWWCNENDCKITRIINCRHWPKEEVR